MSDFMHPPSGYSTPIVITEDGGGLVSEYIKKATQYTQTKRKVVITGSCRSACLVALSVPNVCVGPNAIVKAHHAYEQFSGKIRPDITEIMVKSLPAKLQDYLRGQISKDYTDKSSLSAQKLVSLGISKCSDGVLTESTKHKSFHQLLVTDLQFTQSK